LVAFIGDQGVNADAKDVLALIEREGADAVVHNGDFDYTDDPAAWDAQISGALGENFPYFSVVGNHDARAWPGVAGYNSYVRARMERVPEIECTGELGVMANCTFRGLHLVQSCVGTNELRASCGKDAPEQLDFLEQSLTNDQHLWSICAWHKNQSDMQVGRKADEVGWKAYQVCQTHGSLITTGHEHSYSRTRTLTAVGNTSIGHGPLSVFERIELGPGKTAAIVSGLGGQEVRDYSGTNHDDDSWWASYYAIDAWMMNGDDQDGVATYGALFIRFNVDADPKKAEAYFKDVDGVVADEFTIVLD